MMGPVYRIYGYRLFISFAIRYFFLYFVGLARGILVTKVEFRMYISGLLENKYGLHNLRLLFYGTVDLDG